MDNKRKIKGQSERPSKKRRTSFNSLSQMDLNKLEDEKSFSKLEDEKSFSKLEDEKSFSKSEDEKCFSNFKFPGVSEAINSYNEAYASVHESSEMELPESVSILKFAQCRASEIASLMDDIKTKRPKLSLQQLPFYMRRRAASHSANRVPRRLRERALREIQKAKKTKRPSRKHRRRPSNLLMEYIRRQRDNCWLETHIWFAKRFKTAKLWGYVIPLCPNDKSIRAGFKASSQYVMLQDLSYLCCIELMGPELILLEKLSQLTDNSTGLTFASKTYLSGTREGSIVLYNPLSFPYDAIGPVSFIWKPSFDTRSRKLWIWCHPAVHNKLVETLKIIFDLISCQESHNEVTPPQYNQEKIDILKVQTLNDKASGNSENCMEKDNDSNENSTLIVEDKKLNYRFRRTTTYSKNSVSLTLLKDALVRHRLIGPRSHTVITDALQTADLECNVQEDKMNWWEKFYAEKNHKRFSEKQKQFWSQVQKQKCPNDVPPKIVLGLTVKDPRLYLPKRKTNVSPDLNCFGTYNCNGISSHVNQDLSFSPLWDEAVRDEVTATKLPESKLNKIRSQCLIPGTPLDLGRDEARIPVIVIQQPGVNGFASGWDVISPLGWSMPFWIAFIYRGARAFGLHQLQSISRDAGIPAFPFNYPDTECGRDQVETQRKAMMEKYFRYPPSKRPSFQKLGTLTPYFMPYDVLIADWIKHALNKSSHSFTENGKFFVLRNKKELRQLQKVCEFLQKLSKLRHKDDRRFNDAKELIENFESKLFDSDIKYSLVCIKIKSLNRGHPREYSGLYMPSDADITTLKESPQFRGPIEPIHIIPKVSKEKIKRKKKKKNEKSSDAIKKKTIKNDQRLIRPTVTNLTNHCSRQLMGFLEIGSYSYLNGCGNGLGYCSYVALVELMKKCLYYSSNIVILLRSQKTLQYHLANIDIVQNIC